MITKKSDKIDYDKIINEDVKEKLSEKAQAVLKAVIMLKNNGEENITNRMVSEELDLTPRQVVGVMNGIVKKGLVVRDKAEVMVKKEVTIFRMPKLGEQHEE